MLKPRVTTFFYFAAALAYSGLIFYIAPRLPVWTKEWAAALTWVVYAKAVKLSMVFLSVILLFVVFIKWLYLPHKWRFLGLGAAFSGITALLLVHLGDSVNEYIHFPEYAACVLIWYAAFDCRQRHGQRAETSLKACPLVHILAGSALCQAIGVGLLLGVAEELYQAYLPQRVYDFYDILLNFMGVWLGGMLVWIFRAKKDPGTFWAPRLGDG